MNARGFDPELTRPAQNGVYFVGGGSDLERLARTAARDDLQVCRIDLHGCRDRHALLQRLALALALPASFGHNWDALTDCLRDLGWLPAWGHVLLFEHADGLRHAAPADFEILLGILDDAATFAGEQDQPWFAFLALPDELSGRSPAAAPEACHPESFSEGRTTMQNIEFELQGDYVELNMLLKLTGLCDSGGAGKAIVASGAVAVDGSMELRKTCKIRAGQQVVIGDVAIHVLADSR